MSSRCEEGLCPPPPPSSPLCVAHRQGQGWPPALLDDRPDLVGTRSWALTCRGTPRPPELHPTRNLLGKLVVRVTSRLPPSRGLFPPRPPTPGPDVCPFVLQGELDLEKGSEMRKWVLSGILASEETYLSHLEALLLVRGYGGGPGGRGGPGQRCREGRGAAPACPRNPRQHPQEGGTRPGRRGRPSPGGRWAHS